MTPAAALFADVYARPDDDGPRLVLADFLQEKGDPRGEFIALQFQPDAASAKKAAQLLKQHEEAWLGPLLPVLGKERSFRRGFPATALVKLKQEAQGALTEWATFEELTWAAQSAAFIGPAMKHLKRAIDLRDGIRHLFTAAEPWALESLRCVVRDTADWDQLCGTPLLPKLTHLHVPQVDPAWATRVPASLKTLEVSVPQPGALLEPLRATGLQTLIARAQSGRITVTRRADGAFRTVHAQLAGLKDVAVRAMTDALRSFPRDIVLTSGCDAGPLPPVIALGLTQL